MDSAILAELRAIREILADLRDLQAAMVHALVDEGEEQPGTDLEGRPQPRDRAEGEAL